MAIKPIENLTPTWFTPESEKDAEKPTRFLLRPLNGEELDQVMHGASFKDGGMSLTPDGIRAALRFGIKDWENFEESSGRAVKCSFPNHAKLPWSVRLMLAIEIINRSQLTEEEEKNS